MISDALGQLIKFLVFILFLVAIFFAGFYAAEKQCSASINKSEYNAEKIKYDNLKKQYDDDEVQIAQLKDQKNKIQVVTNDVVHTIIKKVPVNANCDIHEDVISQINIARSGTKK